MAKSQENGTTILLGLKGYEVVTVTESEGKIIVEASAQENKPVCPCCSSVKLYRHGLGKRRRVLHSWSNGKRVYLELSFQRWRCQGCGHSFNGQCTTIATLFQNDQTSRARSSMAT